MALTLEALEALIDNKVLSGGRRTKGVSMRQVLKEIAYFSDVAGGTAWGDITGTLSAQTDLQNALNGKVSLLTGSVLFDFDSSTEWGITNDNNGYLKAWQYQGNTYNQFAFKNTSLNVQDGYVRVQFDTGIQVFRSGLSGDVALTYEIAAVISDTAYDATSWNGVLTIAPSKNAVRDEFENKVSKTTGNILFNFRSASAFDITNDGAGGNYSKGYLYFDASEIELGWGINYMSVGNATGFTFRNGGGVITMPTTTGTLALTSDVALKVSKSGDTMSGNLLFSGGSTIDTTATGGSDVLNIGTTNAEIINIGNSATVLNFLGTAIFEYQANQYVTDKLITLNYGGSLASGIGSGFEIEENSVITGYLKTNGSRTGFSMKSPANAGVIDIITIGTDVVLTAGTTGTIAVTQNKLSVFAATTSAELLSVISDETGSGALVFANTPTLVTPVLGVATATSINGNAITAGSGTLTLSGFTLTVPATGTAALLGTANVFTADQSHTANIIPTATNTYDFGANTSTGDWRKAYIRTITVADASGTNTTGTSLSLLAGAGTGTGTETYLAFQTAIKGTSGSTVQSLANTMTIGLLSGSSTFATIWMNTVPASRTNSNYVLSSDAAGTFLNGSTSVNLSIAGSTKVGVTSTNINLISTNIVSGGSTSSVFRLTNGGSDVTAHFCIDPQGSVSTAGGLAYTFDATNGMSFTHANGTRRIRGWSAKLTTLVNTSGSESSDITWTPQNATDNFIIAGNLNLSDTNFVLGTTTGTKIGTATSQKLAFWNATPIVQITTSVTAATFVANTSLTANDSATWDGYTIGQIVKALRNLGLLA